MRRYVKAKRVAVAGVCHNCHKHHATASWTLGMAVFRRAHWLRLQSIEPGQAVMCRCHQAQRLAATHGRAARQRHATASWCLAIAVLRIGH